MFTRLYNIIKTKIPLKVHNLSFINYYNYQKQIKYDILRNINRKLNLHKMLHPMRLYPSLYKQYESNVIREIYIIDSDIFNYIYKDYQFILSDNETEYEIGNTIEKSEINIIKSIATRKDIITYYVEIPSNTKVTIIYDLKTQIKRIYPEIIIIKSKIIADKDYIAELFNLYTV
jgi:hypothetical protein